MTNPRLRLIDLVHGLERFGDRYEALDVFADDVLELRTQTTVPGLQAIDQDGRRFRLAAGEKNYELELFPETGVVRLSRAKGAPPPSLETAMFSGVVIGGLAGIAIAIAADKKGEAAGVGLVLGMLAGAALGGGLHGDAPRRVFTLSFDPATGRWQAYDGGLVTWMKEQLSTRVA